MFTIKFRDPQGTTYENALVAVRTLNGSANNNSMQTLDLSDRTNPSYTVSDTDNKYITYTAVYWPSQELYDQGFAPYVLYSYDSNNAGDINFSFQVDDSYAGLDYIACAEKHLTDAVLDTVFPAI